MNTFTKILCRTVGTAGMGLAAYDAIKVGGQTSRNRATEAQGKYLEKVYFDSRTTDDFSYVSNSMRKATFDLRTKLPFAQLWGRVKGAFEGSLYSLGTNILTIACSALALLAKGTMAKVGAIGTVLVLLVDVLRNGFGFGKEHPMR